jgi:hypothetical protein
MTYLPGSLTAHPKLFGSVLSSDVLVPFTMILVSTQPHDFTPVVARLLSLPALHGVLSSNLLTPSLVPRSCVEVGMVCQMRFGCLLSVFGVV